MAEIDSNLTLWNDDGVLTLHYTKVRGIPFEPVTLALEPQQVGFSDGSVTDVSVATVVSDREVAAIRAKALGDADVLLEAMRAMPNGSLSDWAEACGWERAGKPYRQKVANLLKKMDRDKKVVRDASGQYVIRGR